MPKLAIQERMLPGRTVQARLEYARQLKIDAVEFGAQDLDSRLPDIAAALEANGMAACGINMGRRHGCLSADLTRRDQATDELRQALACALDLEADYVSFVSLCGESDLPDLTPYASPIDLQKEMLIWLLRGLSDLADAMDCQFALRPINHYETSFVTRVGEAAFFRRKVDNHPKITIAASLYHMALEEEDLLQCLQAHRDDIAVIYLSDNNGRLPGLGLLPFAAIGKTLREMQYDGWLVLQAYDQERSQCNPAHLPACLEFLQRVGIV